MAKSVANEKIQAHLRSELLSERVNVRIAPEAKATIARAASALDRSLSDFIVKKASLETAERTLADETRIALSDAALTAFERSIGGPPKAIPGSQDCCGINQFSDDLA
jgi:uncharacterized protein (DUF1778 family)